LVGLALDAEVHDVVTANGAVVDDDIPSPESNGVPLLDLETFLVALCSTGLAGLGLRRGRVCHVDIRHDYVMYRGGGVRGELVGVEAAGVDAARW